MSSTSFDLHFAGAKNVQLIETRFRDTAHQAEWITVRGKTPGAFKQVGTFQWTAAVRALSILFVKAKLLSALGEDPNHAIVSGSHGSLAASLDYAITKKPAWLEEMFGTNACGIARGQRLFNRSNSHRKRPGPVVLGLNVHAISPVNISITNNGKVVECTDLLNEMLINLTGSHGDEPSAGSFLGHMHQLAA